jgi:hypothetical protein
MCSCILVHISIQLFVVVEKGNSKNGKFCVGTEWFYVKEPDTV